MAETVIPFAPPALPHNSEAERACIGSALIANRKIPAMRQTLEPRDFFVPAHAILWAAICDMAESGRPVDTYTLDAELHSRGDSLYRESGGMDIIQDIASEVESAGNAEHYAGIVKAHSERRVFLRLGEHIQRAAIDPTVTPEDLAGRLSVAAEAASSRRVASMGIPWLCPLDIFAPVPPVPWIIPGLHLAPGRPAIMAGYGASGKTLACQALAVAAAAGIPVWGHFQPAKPIHVRHIDAEQGQGATRRRYKRLAYAMQILPEQLGDRLELVSFPPLALNQPGAEQAWRVVAAGADLVIVDSLRAMTPGVDENSSEVRRYLDPLTRISEATGCVFLIIHHAGKTPTDPNAGRRDSRQRLRGSSGIFDAAGCVFLLTGDGHAARKVEQAKPPADAEGGALDPFYLSIEDVPNEEGDTRAGVQVVYHAEAPEAEREAEAEKPSERMGRVRGKIVEALSVNSGLSSRAIVELVGGRAALVYACLDEMVLSGQLTKEKGAGKGAPHAFTLR